MWYSRRGPRVRRVLAYSRLPQRPVWRSCHGSSLSMCWIAARWFCINVGTIQHADYAVKEKYRQVDRRRRRLEIERPSVLDRSSSASEKRVKLMPHLTGCGKTYLFMKSLSAPCDKTGFLPLVLR